MDIGIKAKITRIVRDREMFRLKISISLTLNYSNQTQRCCKYREVQIPDFHFHIVEMHLHRDNVFPNINYSIELILIKLRACIGHSQHSAFEERYNFTKIVNGI
jgi:hypothetical protein